MTRICKLLNRCCLALVWTMFLGCGGAWGAEASVVAVVGHLGEAFVVDVLAEAPVSVQTAWEVLTDFENMTAILSNLTSSKVLRREGNTLVLRQTGVARSGPFSFSFESEREIRLEPMKRILAKSLSGNVKRMESEARLAPSANGVQIKYRAEIVPESGLARMFGAPFLRGEVEEQFLEMTKEMMKRQAMEAGGKRP